MTELIRHEQMDGRVRQDIDAGPDRQRHGRDRDLAPHGDDADRCRRRRLRAGGGRRGVGPPGGDPAADASEPAAGPAEHLGAGLRRHDEAVRPGSLDPDPDTIGGPHLPRRGSTGGQRRSEEHTCRVTRSGRPPSTARAPRTRPGPRSSPSASGAIEVAARDGGGDLDANATLRTAFQKARAAVGAARHDREGDQARDGRPRGRALRVHQLRGVRPRWRRHHRRDPERQPQPHGRRDAQSLQSQRRQHGRAGGGVVAVRAQGHRDRAPRATTRTR